MRLLALAADQLAWASAWGTSVGLGDCLREAFRYEHLQLRCGDVFDRLEYLERVAAGWHALKTKGAVPGNLLELLARSWARPFGDVRRDVTALLASVSTKPGAWLVHLDRINEASPHLLSLFGRLLDSYQWALDTEEDGREPADLTALARQFLEEHGGLRYSVLRPRLLAFCLREWIHPDVIGEVAVSGTVLLPEARLNKLVNDWPLRHIFRACSLFRS